MVGPSFEIPRSFHRGYKKKTGAKEQPHHRLYFKSTTRYWALSPARCGEPGEINSRGDHTPDTMTPHRGHSREQPEPGRHSAPSQDHQKNPPTLSAPTPRSQLRTIQGLYRAASVTSQPMMHGWVNRKQDCTESTYLFVNVETPKTRDVRYLILPNGSTRRRELLAFYN